MNRTLLDIVCCPSCGCSLDLTDFHRNADVASGNAVRGCQVHNEVETGMLACPCGMVYPIIEGVPRLLEAGIGAFPRFITTWLGKINALIGCADLPISVRRSEQAPDFEYIRRSFTKEWDLFDYAGDKTWGWTLEERKKVFLDDVFLTQAELHGKLILDAGCGNGTLTAALASLGAEVVGIDLNDGLGLANQNKERHAGEYRTRVHFVQGNLGPAPLKPGVFDLIYCSGVIHHTPNSKATFEDLVPLVKNGGRLYVWVYRKRSFPVRAFFAAGRKLKNFVSRNSLMNICRAIAPSYKLATSALNALRISRFRKRNCREITLDLFDAFAPQYNHWHTEEEVRGWFKEQGFANVAISGRQKHGFGVYGDKV